jgi:hypothetical protein
MCDNEPEDPTLWNPDCVYGVCTSCPQPDDIEIPSGKENQLITYSQWMYGVDPAKKMRDEEKNKKNNPGRVFGLFQVTQKAKDAINCLKEMLPKFQIHFYSAYCQWRAHTTNREALDNKSIITIEDYQQNMEVEYNENPPTMAYSTNNNNSGTVPHLRGIQG